MQGFKSFFPRTEENKTWMERIREEADKMVGTPIESLSYFDFNIFYNTGSRVEYEHKYMIHRRRLWHFLAMSMWEDDAKWIAEVSEILSAICSEHAWALPAHVKKDATYLEMRTRIDLFAAETACALAETVNLLGDRLPVTIREMVLYNIDERITRPYLSSYYDYGPANWSAVCHGCVAICFMSLKLTDAFEQGKEYILKGLNRFLESYADDGVCQEGILYWNYGFGHFAYAASMLREYTNGEIDLLKIPKVKNIASFYENAFVSHPYTIPFSDSGHLLYLNHGLISFLSKEFGTSQISKEAAMKYGYDTRWRFCDMIRNFFWGDGFISESKSKAVRGMKFFPDAQWYINRKNRYVLAAKGGHNCEPHNHNDVGSVVIFSNGKYVVDDLGWPEYDGNYFKHETHRYKDYICASSLGHSVPVVDYDEQMYGKDYYATVIKATDDVFALDLSHAYGLKDNSVTREICLGQNEVKIHDNVSFDHTVISRISVRIEPKITSKGVEIGNALITPVNECSISISEEPFETRYSVARSDTGRYVTAYLIDFVPKNDKTHVELLIKFKKRYRKNEG